MGIKHTILSAALSASLLSACVLPPKEAAHPRPLADATLGLSGTAVEPPTADWWSSFGDPQLDRLVRLGLDKNPTLTLARARVGAALAQVESAHAGLLPSANLDASALYQRAPQSYVIPPPLAGHSFWMGQAGVSLGWDLDFWGRQADALHGARDVADAARLDEDNARLMLSGAIAQSYVELYRQRALADIAARSEAQRQNIVEITHRRVRAGLDTQLEVRQAEGQLPQARVARQQAQAAADLAVHELATLAGQGADAYGTIQRPAMNVDAALPVPAELPINLLARRPDVLSARAGVAAADADRLAAKAAFYPSVSLRALAGVGAFGLNNLIDWSARGYGAGPLISLPLFDGGRLRAGYRASEARLDSAIAGYNDTVLRAVRETADQITRLDALAQERADQQQTLDANEAAYRLAEERYRAGLASYLTVLNAETQVLAARQGMVNILADQAIARIDLLLAVGGSFDPRSARPASEASELSAGTHSGDRPSPAPPGRDARDAALTHAS